MNVVLAALLMLAGGAQVGPVGAPVTVAPESGVMGGSASLQAITYADSCDRYLSLFLEPSPAEDLENIGQDLDLHGSLIDPVTGTPGPMLALETSTLNVHSPAAAWNALRRQFLVVFAVEAGDIHGLILDENGAPVGGSLPFPISVTNRPRAAAPWYLEYGGDENPVVGMPRVASDGSGWLVVWGYQWQVTYPAGVEGRIVSGGSTNAAPQFSGDVIIVRESGDYCSTPTVAFGAGREYFVTWIGYSNGKCGVQGRTVSPAGIPGPLPAPGDFYNTTTWPATWTREPVFKPTPILVANRSNAEYLLAWDERADTSVTATSLCICRIGATGILRSSPEAVVSNPLRLRTQALIWNEKANQYLVAWAEPLIDPVTSLGVGEEVRAVIRLGADASALPIRFDIAGPMKRCRGLSLSSRNDRDVQVAIQWIEEGSTGLRPLRVQRMNLPDPATPLISGAAQLRRDGTTAIPPGATIIEASFVLMARLLHLQGKDLRLEAEVRESGAAFSGTATSTGPFMKGGGLGSVTLSGIPRGRDYHWQVRALDSEGHASPWLAYQPDPAAVDIRVRANQAALPTSVTQWKTGGSSLDIGERILEDSAQLRVAASDADGDDVMIEFEIRPVGLPFRGEATVSSAFVPAGVPVTAALQGLAAADYHWAFRVIVAALDAGPWISFGGNAESDPDFGILALGSRNQRQCFLSTPGSIGMGLLLVLPGFVLLRGRR